MSLEPCSETTVKSIKSPFSIAVGRIAFNITTRRPASANEKLRDDTASQYLPELDVILKKGDLSPRQVLHAIRKNALGGRKGKWVQQYKALDYTFGTLMAVPFLAFLIVLLPLHWQPLSHVDRITWGAMVCFSVVGILILANEYWLPHIYARRALAVLREHHTSTKAQDE